MLSPMYRPTARWGRATRRWGTDRFAPHTTSPGPPGRDQDRDGYQQSEGDEDEHGDAAEPGAGWDSGRFVGVRVGEVGAGGVRPSETRVLQVGLNEVGA